MSVDAEAWKSWTPAAQQRALEELRRRVNDAWRPFYCPRAGCNGKPHDDWAWNHARADQHPPSDPDWLVWLMLSGRGAGKTRAGAEYTHRMSAVTGRIALIGATAPDVRDTMLEGESGLLTIAAPGHKPHHEPSKRRLTWPNGCIATTFSAEEPDRLRGPEHGYAWVDEPAHFTQIQDTWDNLMFGLRIGKRPRVVCTSTPKPRPWVKAVSQDPTTRVTRSSTYDNVDNLAPVFAERIIAKYAGTRLGRQELFGEILEDVEGALWSWEMIEAHRAAHAPALSRVVVGVDPAGGAKPHNDETGIITVGFAHDHLYVLSDRSGRYSPQGWANAADADYQEHQADAIIAETNYGGDMVTSTLRSAGVDKRVLKVHSRRGKAIRAEPIVALYEQGRVHHVGVFADLETELTTWAPYEDRDSPNRLDALVHAATALIGRGGTVSIATPQSLAARREARLRAVQAG
jgi:phage terminase large subunit-like protein